MLLKYNTCNVYVMPLPNGSALSFEKLPKGRVVNCRQHENVNAAIDELKIWGELVAIAPNAKITIQ